MCLNQRRKGKIFLDISQDDLYYFTDISKVKLFLLFINMNY